LGQHLYNRLLSLGHQVLRGNREGEIPEKVDILYDVASYGNIWGQDDKMEMYRVNVERLGKILNQKKKYKQAVITSTSSVTMQHTTDYALSKAGAEEIASEYGATVMRPASVTGVGEQDQHLIPKLIDSCLNGTEMEFVPSPTHDFIDVTDVVSAYTFVAENWEKCKGKTFQVSKNRSYSNEEVKYLIEQETGSKANVKIVDNLRPYDSKDWKIDNTDLLELGWVPLVSLAQSIRSMVLSSYANKSMRTML